MVNVNDFKTGMSIKYEGNIYSVVDYQHVKPGKGAAFVTVSYTHLPKNPVYRRLDYTILNPTVDLDFEREYSFDEICKLAQEGVITPSFPKKGYCLRK